MGITGLLPFVKNACRPANIRDFQGTTVAIDAYSWLHKGAFACADKIVKGEKTDGYVYYCMKQLNMLLDAGVKPIMVFDGCNLESKAVTEKKRRENREKTKQRGKEYLCEGKIKEARECFQRCVDVTPEMALEVIQACRKKKVDCIVAPYEADAQLAYLAKINIAQIVITEDSDLILFGCEKILFKMDSFGGGLLYEKENLPNVFGKHAEKMSFEKFRYMCILSGCDYLPSLPGIGLAKAFKFFTLTNNPDLLSVLPKLPSYLKMPHLVVTSEYKDAFVKANNTFLYQLVFCPHQKGLVPLNPYPESMDASEMGYAGEYLSNDLALQLAKGNISVKTLKKLEFSNGSCPDVDVNSDFSGSIWETSGISSKSNPTTPKSSYFKVKQTSPKSHSLTSTKKKRTLDGTSDETGYAKQDQLLFSGYCSKKSPLKKQKLEDDNFSVHHVETSVPSERTPQSVFLPFGKTLSSNSCNVDNSFSNLPLRKIIRSRFFVGNTAEANQKAKTKLSLLDSIDSEFQVTPSNPNSIADSTSLEDKDEELDSGIVEDILELVADADEKENIALSESQTSQLDSLEENEQIFSDSTQSDNEPCNLESSSCPLILSDDCEHSVPSTNICSEQMPVIRKDVFANAELSKCLQEIPSQFDVIHDNDSDVDSSQYSNRDSSQCSSLNSSQYSCKDLSQDNNSFAKFLFQPLKIERKKGPTKCRMTGLSKKQTKSQNQRNIVDTLFNFRFTRSPKITLT